jgi:hypothetical protein
VGKTEGNIPLRIPGHRWDDNAKVDLQAVGWGVDWIDLAKYRDKWCDSVNAVMNILIT